MLGSLFCDRAAAAQRGFALAPETVPAVVDICRRLDGIPLAIELAAARVGVPTPGQIAARLDDWFRLLAHTDSLAGDRQRTLIGALDWSHDLLPLRERILLRRLSVFMGGCTFEAIEAVRGDDGDGEGILDPLAALVAKALVVTDMAGSAARYRLLETVRAYGAQHLREAGEESVVRKRHGQWCPGRDSTRKWGAWVTATGPVAQGGRRTISAVGSAFGVAPGGVGRGVVSTEVVMVQSPPDRAMV